MTWAGLYHVDIYAWSEQQVDVLRRLAHSGLDLPNDLDLEHVAEEIEDLGKSQRDAEESFIRQILVHLLKLAATPTAPSARHWRAEIVAFHNDLLAKLTPGMHHRIQMDVIWKRSIKQACAKLEAEEMLDDHALAVFVKARLAPACPLDAATLAFEDFDIDAAVADLSIEN